MSQMLYQRAIDYFFKPINTTDIMIELENRNAFLKEIVELRSKLASVEKERDENGRLEEECARLHREKERDQILIKQFQLSSSYTIIKDLQAKLDKAREALKRICDSTKRYFGDQVHNDPNYVSPLEQAMDALASLDEKKDETQHD